MTTIAPDSASHAAITPFHVAVPDAALEDLHARLEHTRLPSAVAGVGWDYGVDVTYLGELIEYWQRAYAWRAAEAGINRLPQFMADVQGITLHFVHARGVGPAPLPLLFAHGWPGSFWEVHKILGPLTDPGAHGGDPADAFDVVAPSLPGFTFSPDPARPGLGTGAIAEVFAALMRDVLGYESFGLQAGDLGAIVGSRLALRHPELVRGLHLNLVGLQPSVGFGGPPPTQAELAMLDAAQRFQQTEGAYMAIQATRPQSLAVGLSNSPAGLAGWLIEKFRAWSDCGGDLERVFSRDDLLTSVMLYWVTGCIGSSVRLYAELFREGGMQLAPGQRVEVPTGYARFPAELMRPPRQWMERAYTIQHWTDFPRGGHFAALEEPELLVEDIRAFFRPLRS